MKVTGTWLKDTPIFRVAPPDKAKEPWSRAFGAVQRDGVWLTPAYYPFGNWAFSDLQKLAKLEWDPSAVDHLKDLRKAELEWKAALEAFEKGERVPLPSLGLESGDFFPPGFEPYNYQRLGIARAATWWRSFFLWDMGTGKTRTLIDGYRISRRENPKVGRMLVIAPPIVLPTWVREVKRCSRGELKAVVWDGTEEAATAAEEADVVVLTYARARIEKKLREKTGKNRLHALPFSVVTADESHLIGNPDSDQTEACAELSMLASRRYLLSGTAADHPGKLYSQLKFLAPGLMPMSWSDYKRAYFVPMRGNRNIVVGYMHLDALNDMVDRVAIRMKKSTALPDLPPVTFTDIPYDLSAEQTAEYDACIARLRAYDQFLDTPELQGYGVHVSHGGNLVNKLLQILSGFLIENPPLTICDSCPKLVPCVDQGIRPYTKACEVAPKPPPSTVKVIPTSKRTIAKELLENILDDDETNKVILWGTYSHELDDLEAMTKALKVGYVRVDGSTTSKIGAIEEKFQNDPACRVYIGQISSGVGVTLTAANFMIYYALTWNLTTYKQSLERNNRPGQKRNTTVYRLLSTHEGALDRYLAKVLQFKDAVAYTLLEQVTCSRCPHNEKCAAGSVKPFRPGCKFSATVEKPVAKAEYLVQLSTRQGRAG